MVDTKPDSKPNFSGPGRIILWLVVSLPLFFLAKDLSRYYTYKPVQCTIVSDEWGKPIGTSRTSQRIIAYRYELDGQKYVGSDSYSMTGGHGSRGSRVKSEAFDRAKVGSTQTCRYDPENPGGALLVLWTPWVMYLFLLIPFFL